MKYYVVWNGRKTGIFKTWDECKKQIHRYPDAKYKSFKNLDDAKLAYATKKSNTVLPDKYLTVDVGCRRNGDVEYQLVLMPTEEVIYKSPVYKSGTNNIGEFLAVVHGIRWISENGHNFPVYTDSRTALAWLRDKKVNTTVKWTDENDELYELLEDAIWYLRNENPKVEVLKWNTRQWGEIPADYGRK